MIRHGFELLRRTDDDCLMVPPFFCLYQKSTTLFAECHGMMQNRQKWEMVI